MVTDRGTECVLGSARDMGATSLNQNGVRTVGPFTFDPDCGELTRNGYRVRLPPQPTLVLVLLTDQPGKLIAREEIYRTVWGEDTHVDFEQSLNSCIRQIRSALRDDANNPKYLETVPKRGFRFLAPAEISNGNGSLRSAEVEPAVAGDASAKVFTKRIPANAGRRRLKFPLLLAVVLTLLAVSVVAWLNHRRQALPLHPNDTILIADLKTRLETRASTTHC
jgi:DNA-binding winged helix-turn-helix (wHTH) protein